MNILAPILMVAVNPNLATALLPFEDYTAYTNWVPVTDHLSVTISPGNTETFNSYDRCWDDSTTVPATGSLPTTGSGAPTLSWTGWFVNLYDNPFANHKKNTNTSDLIFHYDLISCDGFQKFVGNTSGNVYRRNGSEWHYTGAFDGESD